MHDIKWSPSEKRIARRAFDEALATALALLLADFKERAASVASASDLWAVEDWLRERRQTLDATFDYRYSQLPFVFAALIARGLLDEARLSGLSDEKLEMIRRFVQR